MVSRKWLRLAAVPLLMGRCCICRAYHFIRGSNDSDLPWFRIQGTVAKRDRKKFDIHCASEKWRCCYLGFSNQVRQVLRQRRCF